MPVFKCKMCGGDLNVSEDTKVIECEYCGTTQTTPMLDSEKKTNLFNRANRLRMNSEFDKSANIYEQIIAEFPDESEAYWGLCLCNYGIEYVDDPLTAKKIPTCHRASFEKLSEDENFQLAMEYADVEAQRIYRNEAREIDRIMDEILSISRNEKPYDIFICYKETDKDGGRTPDSVLAYDIYDALNAKGYKVFFSRVTLEDKLGQQYEPYIFAALNSAKIMISVGTKYEYFHAVWVKNEWSRFLKLMAKDKSKMIIPCYKDMDPYDLPDEFRGLQAQDMGKLGAVQDIVRGIQKIISAESEPVAAASAPAAAPQGNSNIKEVKLPDGGLYVGEAIADQPHGNGKAIYPDGSTYEGGWAFGKYSGQGIFNFADGQSWSGEYKVGKQWNGKGLIKYNNEGNYYNGIIIDGKLNGEGELNYGNGSKYIGNFKDDKRDGEGTFTYADGKSWTGEWKNDARWNGKGHIKEIKNGRISGDCYDGEFHEGLYNGEGIINYANGNKYMGNFTAGKRNGVGTFNYADGNSWSGIWSNDTRKSGTGMIKFKSGATYEGALKEGLYFGKARYVFSNGNCYIGNFADSKMNGEGVLYYKNGKKWSGIWKDDAPFNGEGYYNGHDNFKVRNGKL